MRLIHCACGPSGADVRVPGAERFELSEAPSRKELRLLDDVARQVLPVDPTPSLDEIQKRPDVEHLGAPAFAPQRPAQRLRVVVSGTDRSLGAVLTRMMRGDYMWAEVGYVPASPESAAAVAWGLPGGADAVSFAVEAPVVPSPIIRTDTGDVVAGAAELYHGDGTEEYVGEIVADSTPVVFRTGEERSARFFGQFGARLVPTPDAPGIAVSPLVTPLASAGKPSSLAPEQLERISRIPVLRGLVRNAAAPAGLTDPTRVYTGRAVQSGGVDITVSIDGQVRPRTVSRVTFYRHLRDLQSVRSAPTRNM